MNDPLSSIIRWCLIALIVITPWFFGGVFAHTQWILLAVASALLLLDFLRTVLSDEEERYLPTLILVLFGGILLGTAQLIPLAPSLQNVFAPQATELRQQLIDVDTAEGETASEQSAPRSLYPASTRENLALLFLAASVCYLSSIYLRDGRSIVAFFAALTVCGVAMGFFGIVQKISWNGQIYWQVPLTYGRGVFGPYVNRNNAGGFLNLCLAAALGLLVYVTSRSDHDEPYERWSKGKRRRGTYELDSPLLVQLNSSGIALIVALAFLAGAIICSASRGSMLSLIAATLVASGMLLFRARSRRFAWPLILAIGAGVPLMAWAGQTEAVQARIALLFGDEGQLQAQDGRLEHWPDALAASKDFRFLGSGLGTYRYVYAPKQQWFIGEKWFFHAENQFIEALLDAGLVGLGLVLTAIALVIASIILLYRTGRRYDSVLAVAGAYALTSQIVGGSFDFGLYLPANMMLLAAFCGCVCGRAGSWRAAHPQGLRPAFYTRLRTSGWAMPLAGALLLLGCVFGTIELRRLAAIETVTRESPLEVLREEREAEPIEILIARLKPALRNRWDDAEVHRHMADLWMQLYRTKTYADLELQQPSSNQQEADVLWDRASLWQLHGAVRRLQREGSTAAVNFLVAQPTITESLRPAWYHLQQSRRSCPLIAHVHYALAELTLAIDPSSNDAEHLLRAMELAPGDATLAYWSGVLHSSSGRYELAVQSWRRSLKLGGTLYLNQILARLEGQPDAVLDAVLPDVPEVLIAAARKKSVSEERASQLLRRADRSLRDSVASDAEANYLRATVLRKLKEHEQAVQQYALAIRREPTRYRWRFEYAGYLFELRNLVEAHKHAKICARADRNNRSYEDLLVRINRARSAAE